MIADSAHAWVELDKILDAVEPLLLMGAAEERVRAPFMERWRWDEPEVVLTWIDESHGGLSKSIRFSIDTDHSPYRGSLEVNAWHDVKEANRIVRRWNHKQVDTIDMASVAAPVDDNGHIKDVMRKAFGVVGAWSSDDLDRIHLLRCR